MYRFLKINKNYFENKGDEVFFTGARFRYRDVKLTVKDNELMIAVKNNE